MKKTLLFSIIFSLSIIGFAQEEESASDLAKKLANPNATLGQMLFPIDYIHYSGDIPDANNQNAFLLNFQPSLPIPVSEGLNLYVRPLIPIYLSQPVIGSSDFESKGGLGNISADIAIGKTWPSKWITLAGVFGGFPTATNKALRSSQVTLGPEFMVAKLTSFGALGIIISHAWGVGDPSDPDATSTTVTPDDFWIAASGSANASVTAGQYFYTINLKNGWQINATPTYSYNHNGTDGNKFTFPIATGAQKVLKAGKMPIRLGLQYWYYVARPDAFGPQHQIRFTVAPVVPLPW
ncbi:hypothetical protein KEM09_05125 [Carboxylicivirga mesophila]|uniref:Transporter n=2 Tax=Carboxylicivirga TaxID=1628153 RepID=A0A941F6E4_9BACT|nr:MULTISPECIES: hypothetical protein [Carboxylicivirga]MBR8536090.1 hypothetical protein [Carboxylicivirga sediminis]MBS2210768.1 hypothetical protein [Carboxylicivirga mesophila]